MHAIRIYRNQHGDTRVQYTDGHRIQDVGRDESLGFYIPRTLSAAIYDDRCAVPWIVSVCNNLDDKIPRSKDIFVRDIHEYIELCQVLNSFGAKWQSDDAIYDNDNEYYIHLYHLVKFDYMKSPDCMVCVRLRGKRPVCTINCQMYNADNENHLRWSELKAQILNDRTEGEKYEY